MFGASSKLASVMEFGFYLLTYLVNHLAVILFGHLSRVACKPSRNAKHRTGDGVVAQMALGVVGRSMDADRSDRVNDVRAEQRRVRLVSGERMEEFRQRAEQCVESGGRIDLETVKESLERVVMAVVR